MPWQSLQCYEVGFFVTPVLVASDSQHFGQPQNQFEQLVFLFLGMFNCKRLELLHVYCLLKVLYVYFEVTALGTSFHGAADSTAYESALTSRTLGI
jgi:hypothetical protein